MHKSEFTVGTFPLLTEDLTLPEILHSNFYFSQIIGNSADMISLVSPEGKILYTNQKLNEFFREDKGIEEKCISELFPEKEAEEILIQYAQVIKSGKSLKVHRKFTRQNKTYWFESIISPVYDPKCSMTLLLVSGREITQQLQDFENLRKIANKEVDIIKNSELVSWTLDVKNNIFHCSPNISSVLDEAFTLVSFPVNVGEKYIHPKDLKKAAILYNKCINGICKDFQIHLRVNKKNGDPLWLFVKGSVSGISQNNEVTEIKGSIANINQTMLLIDGLQKLNRKLQWQVKKEYQKQQQSWQLLAQKSKMEMMGELTSGFFHEVNQPLGVMMLLVDALTEMCQQENISSDYLRKKLETFSCNIESIRDLMEQMRVYAKDQRNEVFFLFDFNKVIHDSLGIVKAQFKNHQINLEVDIASSKSLVLGRPTYLAQVFHNLTSNARYAVEQKSEFAAENDYRKTIKITTRKTKNNVKLEIWDNGCGIPAKNLHRLFEPFFTTKGNEIGTGLGLPVTKRLIQEMNGKIKCSSIEGSYTLFTITFPTENALQ